MDYLEYQFLLPGPRREILIAFLSELAFESFEETDWGIKAFLPAAGDREVLEEQLAGLAGDFPFEYKVERLAHRNWNELWESNFPPIRVGDFCGVRADFHEPFTGVAHELLIHPKMAFGTGHHATTHMMIRMMENLPLQGARVLDYGCGTGILAILAARMGAARVTGVDIEEPAYENARENARINGVEEQLDIFLGTLEAVPEGVFDVILANINRNVILSSLSALYLKSAPDGILVISGILRDDEPIVLAEAEKHGFLPEDGLESGEWICRRLKVSEIRR